MNAIRYWLIRLLGGVPKYVADARVNMACSYFKAYRDYITLDHTELDAEAAGPGFEEDMRTLVDWNPKEPTIK